MAKEKKAPVTVPATKRKLSRNTHVLGQSFHLHSPGDG